MMGSSVLDKMPGLDVDNSFYVLASIYNYHSVTLVSLHLASLYGFAVEAVGKDEETGLLLLLKHKAFALFYID